MKRSVKSSLPGGQERQLLRFLPKQAPQALLQTESQVTLTGAYFLENEVVVGTGVHALVTSGEEERVLCTAFALSCRGP